jgi:hypothetical protein
MDSASSTDALLEERNRIFIVMIRATPPEEVGPKQIEPW